jgi:hypothetical protein
MPRLRPSGAQNGAERPATVMMKMGFAASSGCTQMPSALPIGEAQYATLRPSGEIETDDE